MTSQAKKIIIAIVGIVIIFFVVRALTGSTKNQVADTPLQNQVELCADQGLAFDAETGECSTEITETETSAEVSEESAEMN